MLNEELDEKFKILIEQWNIAERRIKKAENVRGGEVVGSAIFELTSDWKNDNQRYGDIRTYLEDATEDCVKAKHDAIDAMLSFVTGWFQQLEQEMGLDSAVELFPDYIDLTSRIGVIQDKIAESRGSRYEARDGIYDEIENSGFDDILSLYERMLRSKDRVVRQARRQRVRKFLERWAIYIAAVGAVALVVIELSH